MRPPARRSPAAKQVGTGNDLSLKLDYATKAAGHLPDRPGHLQDRLQQVRGPAKGKAVKGFLEQLRLRRRRQAGLEELGYAPLPKEVQTKVVTAVGAVS